MFLKWKINEITNTQCFVLLLDHMKMVICFSKFWILISYFFNAIFSLQQCTQFSFPHCIITFGIQDNLSIFYILINSMCILPEINASGIRSNFSSIIKHVYRFHLNLNQKLLTETISTGHISKYAFKCDLCYQRISFELAWGHTVNVSTAIMY